MDAGFEVIEENFIETKDKEFEFKSINNTLIFTSQNAVQSILNNSNKDELKSKTVFCVGLKTKAFLQENGFIVEAYTSYASDLAEIISLVYSKESYTFFSGNLRRDTLPVMLKEAGIKFNEIEVYETKLTPKKIIEKADGILFFSPSAVESYLKVNKISNEICFSIGNTTAETLEKNKIKNIIIAPQPTVESVINTAISEKTISNPRA